MKIINQYLLESFLFSESIIKYNYDNWVNNKIPLLFVTGHSGSGKSILGKKLAEEYKCDYIELDELLEHVLFDNMTQNDITELNKDINKAEIHYQTSIQNMINKLLTSKKRSVIEGAQITLFNEPKKFKNHAIIILGTSTLVSMFRSFIRDIKRKKAKFKDYLKIFSNTYNEFYIEKLKDFRKEINSWIKNK